MTGKTVMTTRTMAVAAAVAVAAVLAGACLVFDDRCELMPLIGTHNRGLRFP
jgi:hypothetical protein